MKYCGASRGPTVWISVRPKATLSHIVWLGFFVQSVTVPVGHLSDVKHRPKSNSEFSIRFWNSTTMDILCSSSFLACEFVNNGEYSDCHRDLPIVETEIECTRPLVRDSLILTSTSDNPDHDLYIAELYIKGYGGKKWKSKNLVEIAFLHFTCLLPLTYNLQHNSSSRITGHICFGGHLPARRMTMLFFPIMPSIQKIIIAWIWPLLPERAKYGSLLTSVAFMNLLVIKHCVVHFFFLSSQIPIYKELIPFSCRIWNSWHIGWVGRDDFARAHRCG